MQQKTFSQLIGMIESPADFKIVYRMGFPNQSLHKDSQVLSHFSRIQCTGLSYFL